MDVEQTTYLRDILDAASLILEYTDELSREQFFGDVKTQDAVLRRFEIIGEAAAYLTDDTRALFPTYPFRKCEACAT